MDDDPGSLAGRVLARQKTAGFPPFVVMRLRNPASA